MSANNFLKVAGVTCAVFVYGLTKRGKSVNDKWEKDFPIDVKQNPLAQKTVRSIVRLGNPIEGSVISLALGIPLFLQGTKVETLSPFTSFVTTAVLVKKVEKPFFQHTIRGGYSYPSTHSAATFAALLTYSSLCRKRGMSNVLVLPATCLAFLLPTAVWVGRHHRLSEIFAGSGTGWCVSKLVTLPS